VLDEHRAQQRQRILDVALALLVERGMAGLTMSAIADQAGMSRPTLYHYFPDVDAVLAAWVGQEIERSVASLLATAATIADPFDRLVYLVDAQVRTFASQQHRLSAEHFEAEVGAPAVRRAVADQMAPLRQLLADTVREAAADRRGPGPVDADLAADLILGLLGAARRRLVAGTVVPDDAVRSIVGLLRSGWFPPARRRRPPAGGGRGGPEPLRPAPGGPSGRPVGSGR